jgi:2-haloalkanoic acid dehalogenase type II
LQFGNPERRLKLVKGIIFDAYGTLIDTGDGSLQAVKAILRKNNSSIDANLFYRKWKIVHKNHINTLTSFIKEEDIFLIDLAALYVEYEIRGNSADDVKIMLNTLGERKAYPETNFVLKTLQPKYQVFIGSTSDEAPLHNDIRRNGITVNRIFTSEYLKVYKPRKEFYQLILDEISMQPDDVLFVGDSLEDDISGPAAAGMRTVWVNRKNIKYDAAQIRPCYEIPSLNKLLDIID